MLKRNSDSGKVTLIWNHVSYKKKLTEEEFLNLRDVYLNAIHRDGKITASYLDNLFTSNKVLKQRQEVKELKRDLPDFVNFENGIFTIDNIPMSLPLLMLTELRNADKERQMALRKFWYWLSMNPDLTVKKGLFNYLKGQKFILTSNGFIVTYRNVKTFTEENKDLENFVNVSYLKVKNWKKSPKNYNIWQVKEELVLRVNTSKDTTGELTGNLQKLYETPNETVYTDNHTGTFRIKIGEMVRMPREDCDANGDNSCSRGYD